MIKDIEKFKKEMAKRNKKTKKKGFTLVELLAVFVVLAVIAGIAVFSTNNLKKTFTKNVYEESIKNVMDSAKNYYASNSETAFPKIGLSIFDENLEFENKNEYKSGIILYNSITGKLEAQNITNGEYCANGPIDNLVIVEGECPSTDLACFTYLKDSNSVTITDFDYSNSACSGYVVVPSTIESLPVTTIGFAAFADVDNANVEYCEPADDLSIPSATASTSSLNIKVTPLSTGTQMATATDSCVSYTTYYDNTASGDYSCASSVFDLTSIVVGNNGSKILGVTLPSTVTYIDDLAFAETALSFINFDSLTNLSYIGDSSFKNTNLLELDLEGLNRLTTIGFAAFFESNINTLNISNVALLNEIRTGAFYGNNIESLDFTGSSDIEHIGASAFAYNQIASIKMNNLTNLSSLWWNSFCQNPFYNSASTLPDITSLNSLSETDLDEACLKHIAY